jgi:hypothetical protein
MTAPAGRASQASLHSLVPGASTACSTFLVWSAAPTVLRRSTDKAGTSLSDYDSPSGSSVAWSRIHDSMSPRNQSRHLEYANSNTGRGKSG